MAQYIVIQDIEAEDKFVGPLTLRQFIFACITAVLLYVSFLLLTKGFWPIIIILLPPAAVSGFLAFPWGRDQPTEIWLLAKIRFLLKPHLRIWNQSGLQELVTITVPKKVEVDLTNGLNETQVHSRLEALAHTLDTRGWAVKGMDVNVAPAPSYISATSDRLITPPSLPSTATTALSLHTTDDILDMQNNPVAQQMGQLVKANDQAHRQALLNRMEEIRTQTAQTPANTAATAVPATPPPAPSGSVIPSSIPFPTNSGATTAYGQTPVLQPSPSQTQPQPTASEQQPIGMTRASNPAPTPIPEPPKPAIMELANNDDLSVATIARQANKVESLGDDEVVISLR